jgi:hypothetical protein
MITRLLGRAAAACAAVAMLSIASGAAPASAASTNEWRLNYYAPKLTGGLYSVAAVSKTDAWAAGALYDGQTLLNKPYVLHWNGKSWATVSVPGSAGYYASEIAAPAANDVWVFGMDANDSENQEVFHFNGSHWNAIAVPQDVVLDNPVVLSATNVWTSGSTSCSGAAADPSCVTDMWHWNGNAWTDYPISTSITGLAGTSTANLWAAGIAGQNENNGIGKLVAYKWNGAKWAEVSTPHPEVNGTAAAATDATSDVWLSGWTENASTAFALRWNGHEWQQITAPRSLSPSNGVTPDGNGGAWFGAWAHWTGKTWVNGLPIASPVMGGDVDALVKIPGTSGSYWGAATVYENENSDVLHPAMVIYGPVP